MVDRPEKIVLIEAVLLEFDGLDEQLRSLVNVDALLRTLGPAAPDEWSEGPGCRG